MKIRERIAEHSENTTRESGIFEVDESYFGAKRVRGKRGRGASGKTIVFGLLKRDGKVYTQIITGATKAQIMPIIKGKVLEGSTVNSDGWKSYDSLILNQTILSSRYLHCAVVLKDIFGLAKRKLESH